VGLVITVINKYGLVVHDIFLPFNSFAQPCKYGFVNDLKGSATRNWNQTNNYLWYYRKWKDMKTRVINSKGTILVSDPWKTFSNFLLDVSVFSNIEKSGFDLDKDVLSVGDKIYSKETCVLLPKNLNRYLSDTGTTRLNFTKTKINKELKHYKPILDPVVYTLIKNYLKTI
jgi:hypothetical protein